MICPRCGNEDLTWFYKGSRGWYCRRCVQFSRILVLEELTDFQAGADFCPEPTLTLDYPLTPDQQRISDQLCALIENQDVIVEAVCGAGKTEIVMAAIRQTLSRGQRVGMAIARRQVVLELAERLARAFPRLKVIPVCQGYTSDLNGDLIVCTTHQLYRWPKFFDLLIVDEPDAFPFKGDQVLHGIARSSCRGHTIYTTATPDAELMQRVREGSLLSLSLNRRPHGHDLTVPKVKTGPFWLCLFWLAQWLRRKQRQHKQALIFVPTMALCGSLTRLFSRYFKCAGITSKTDGKEEILSRVRNQTVQFCFATTILERGITISGVDVCVFQADHPVFDEASLIQMIGRVGRSFACPDGEGLFLCAGRSDQVDHCRHRIEAANADIPPLPVR